MKYPFLNKLLDSSLICIQVQDELRALFAENKTLKDFAEKAAAAKANVEHLNKLLPLGRLVCQNTGVTERGFTNVNQLVRGRLYFDMYSGEVVEFHTFGTLEGCIVAKFKDGGTRYAKATDLRNPTTAELNKYFKDSRVVWQSGVTHPDYQIKDNPVNGRIYFSKTLNEPVRMKAVGRYKNNDLVRSMRGESFWCHRHNLRRATQEEVHQFLNNK